MSYTLDFIGNSFVIFMGVGCLLYFTKVNPDFKHRELKDREKKMAFYLSILGLFFIFIGIYNISNL